MNTSKPVRTTPPTPSVAGATSATSAAAGAATTVVGIADLAVVVGPRARIVTYALGSCIGLTAYDPIAKVGGMLHFMLAQPAAGSDDAERKPWMFGSSGVPDLIRRVIELGGSRGRLVFCAAGAAEVIQDCGTFAIGQRNRTILRKLFWKENLAIAAEDTGGNAARNLTLDLATGSVSVRMKGEERQLWPK